MLGKWGIIALSIVTITISFFYFQIINLINIPEIKQE
jgi:hypothetical protein